MPYVVIVLPPAARELRKLSHQARSEVVSAIDSLQSDPRPHGCKKLTARQGYRIRAGNYRVIYDVFDGRLEIEVIRVADRKDIYR